VIRAIVENNKILRGHGRRRLSTAAANIYARLIGSADTGMNLAIMNADGISAQSAEFIVLQATYELKRIK
jgi:hypothetical protein